MDHRLEVHQHVTGLQEEFHGMGLQESLLEVHRGDHQGTEAGEDLHRHSDVKNIKTFKTPTLNVFINTLQFYFSVDRQDLKFYESS